MNRGRTEERNAVTSDMHLCPICVEPVLDETEDSVAQDALFCEGSCQCWHHRWCASVSKEQYVALLDSTEPFLYPSCTAANQQNAIASLRDCLNALTDEVRVLKATVAALQKQDCGSNTKVVGVDNKSKETSLATSRTADGGNKLPWNTVVSRGSRGSKRKKTVPNSDVLHHAKETASRESHGSELSTAGHAKPRRKLVPIEDAKRVWGTL